MVLEKSCRPMDNSVRQLRLNSGPLTTPEYLIALRVLYFTDSFNLFLPHALDKVYEKIGLRIFAHSDLDHPPFYRCFWFFVK